MVWGECGITSGGTSSQGLWEEVWGTQGYSVEEEGLEPWKEEHPKPGRGWGRGWGIRGNQNLA